ncbi:MAG: hypothetical protein NTZ61_19680, partial [Proteobacteria bacterium]|nr:hypothetical protein [Pseudomonadota bacterium]
APRADAFDFQDGRLQIHGYVESTVRGLSQDFSWADNMDLAQWYNILGVETEYDFAPDGWGPFDVLSGFARFEVRYDCVWTRACGIFPSANAFGDRVAHLPGFKTSGRRSGMYGTAFVGNQTLYGTDPSQAKRAEVGRFTGLKYEPVLDPRNTSFLNPTGTDRSVLVNQNPRRPARTEQLDGLSGLFAVSGQNGVFEADGDVTYTEFINSRGNTEFGTINDDPAFFYFTRQARCRFGARKIPGGGNGIASQTIGPIDPSCDINPTGALQGKPNPFNPGDSIPIVVNPETGAIRTGIYELPARPASVLLQSDAPQKGISRGVYYPSGAFSRFLQQDKGSDFAQNFSQSELSWNRGYSQQDEKEFKEGYLDMEFFDSRLWVRAGRQNIVWGKTELFRTTDQFNPVDLALASLPSLEEARIALWSVRGVWSFYDVGPLEDVRLEVSMNLDNIEHADIGQCGEPFTPLPACNKRTALWAHGLTGYALAGEHSPPTWWDSTSGLEYGARLEWRAGRFSYQVSDFYGYDDFPYVDQINSYERNVDPNTGRPRVARGRTACVTGYEAACLPIQSNFTIGPNDPNAADPQRNSGAGTTDPDTAYGPALGTAESRQSVIQDQPVNQQLFAMICATSIGFNELDRGACAQSVFNSSVNGLLPQNGPQDDTTRKDGTNTNFLAHTTIPLVSLNEDPCDRFLSDNNGGCTTILGRSAYPLFLPGGPTLNQVLTDEQEALLGCGPFYGTDCESDGIDLLNIEASVLMQSFVGFEGNYSPDYAKNNFTGWFYGKTDANGNAYPQPGTAGFQGAPVGLHNDNGQIIQVVGSRGPNDPGYNPNVDGRVSFAVGTKKGQCAGATALSIPCGTVPALQNQASSPLANGGYRGAAGQVFTSEMAALSFNMQNLLVAFSTAPRSETIKAAAPIGNGSGGPGYQLQIEQPELNPQDPFSVAPNQCSFLQPQYCSNMKSFFSISGAQRNAIRAGGSQQFGRRDFVWQSGGEGVLKYQKRNVLGFSLDFAEDVTKSNWGMEASWIANNQFADNDSFTGRGQSDTLNLTVSVDRPTFINFLNPGRTFFFNSQVFFQYITSYNDGFTVNGPFNMLGTFTIQTGYFQDRMLPGITFVYDLNSRSGAVLPQLTYRFTENFSASVGMNFFFGRFETVNTPIAPLGVIGTEAGRDAYKDGAENALAVVRERDEAYFRLRYTF